jgi:hypothetical protein
MTSSVREPQSPGAARPVGDGFRARTHLRFAEKDGRGIGGERKGEMEMDRTKGDFNGIHQHSQ